MITLPASPNRLWLLSFWLVISSIIGLAVGMLSSLLLSPSWFLLGVSAALVLAVAGLRRPRKLSGPYEFWNGLASKFAYFARLWIMGVCFYVTFFAVGQTGASLRLTRPNSDAKSFWLSRESLAPSAYCQYGASTKGSTPRGWISSFFSWAVGSKNLWACCLLPFLIALRMFETEEESSFPSSIYTLY